MENWFDYINYLLFNISVVEQKYEDGILYLKLCNNVEFNIYITENGETLYDILYWNDLSIHESEEFQFYFKTSELNEDNKQILKSIFDTPVNIGWTDIHYYCEDTLIKIDRHYGINSNRDSKVAYRFVKSKIGLLLGFIKKYQTKIIKIKPAVSCLGIE